MAGSDGDGSAIAATTIPHTVTIAVTTTPVPKSTWRAGRELTASVRPMRNTPMARTAMTASSESIFSVTICLRWS